MSCIWLALIAPEEVPDSEIAVDGDWVFDEKGYVNEDDNGYRVFTASGFETFTIDDIIAEHGPRDPDISQSQKDFRAAVVLLVGTDYSATPEILHSLSEDLSWFSHRARTHSIPVQFLRSNRRSRHDHNGRLVGCLERYGILD